jgi:hypothetical protein
MWIESHSELLNHAKTGKLMRLLHLNNRHTVVGILHSFWWWCLINAPDGNLEGIDPDDIAHGCLWYEGGHVLMLALKAAGFVDSDNHVHDWLQYTGRLVEQRQHDAERKRRAYHSSPAENYGKTEGVENNTDTSVDFVTEKNGTYFSAGENPRKYDVYDSEVSTQYDDVSSVDNIVRSNYTKSPQEKNGSDGDESSAFETFFTVFWRNYPARHGRKVGKAQVKAWLAKNLKPDEYQPMLKAVRNYADNCGDYARDPIRFVKDHWWADWLDTPAAGSAQNGPLDMNKYLHGKYAHLFGRTPDIDYD